MVGNGNDAFVPYIFIEHVNYCSSTMCLQNMHSSCKFVLTTCVSANGLDLHDYSLVSNDD